MALVSNVTRIGLLAPVAVRSVPPLLDVHVTLLLVIAAPPEAGVVKSTDAAPDERVTLLTAGRPGVVAATNALDGRESLPVPTAFFALTVHV